MGRDNLDIPKLGRGCLDMGRESPHMGLESFDLGRECLEIPKFGHESVVNVCPDFRDQIVEYPVFLLTMFSLLQIFF